MARKAYKRSRDLVGKSYAMGFPKHCHEDMNSSDEMPLSFTGTSRAANNNPY